MMGETDFVDNVRGYLTRILGVEPSPLVGWPNARGLPIYLADNYEFYRFELLGKPCLLIYAKQESIPTPSVLQKHLAVVARTTPIQLLYSQIGMTARQRQRLIELRIPFVVPNKQLFLPPLGLDLLEQYAAQNLRKTEVLSPAAQVVISGGLLGLWRLGSHASALARQFGYSAMTLTRVKKELQALELVRLEGTGTSAELRLDGAVKDVWRKLTPMLRSPILRRVWVTQPLPELYKLPLAGLTALAEYSMLSAPINEVHAIGEPAWADFVKSHPNTHWDSEPSPDALTLEIWRYDPQKLIDIATSMDMTCVDRFSLYASLCNDTDPRVSIALDEMMDGFLI